MRRTDCLFHLRRYADALPPLQQAMHRPGASLFEVMVRWPRGHRTIPVLRLPRGANGPEEHVLGVGLGFGRMLRIGDADVFGNEVNSACILGESIARPYEILVTKAVHDRGGDHRFEEIEHVPPGAEKAYRVAYG